MDVLVTDVDITKILFLDIETVPLYKSYIEVPPVERELWNKKSARLAKPNETPSVRYKKAGIFAEFGKIICISVAFVTQKKSERSVRIRSFAGHDERKILEDFAELVTRHYNTPKSYFCAHNGNEFDLPFIARRMLLHGMAVPQSLDTRGKKPWELRHIDTLDLWRFGDYKNYSSLQLLTHIFNIPTPKDDIEGSMVCDIYWKENNLSRIVSYCQKDVLAVVNLFCKYRSEDCIAEDKIRIVNE